MSRTISNVLDITPQLNKRWTVIIQVLESGHVQGSQNDVAYKRLIFTDSHGTKVGAVMYDNGIKYFSELLTQYKRYHISNALVRRTDAVYRVSSYIYSWVLNNKTLVEEFVESIPTSLPCQFDFTNFGDLYKYAVTYTNMLTQILHKMSEVLFCIAFPVKNKEHQLSQKGMLSL